MHFQWILVYLAMDFFFYRFAYELSFYQSRNVPYVIYKYCAFKVCKRLYNFAVSVFRRYLSVLL